MQLKQKSLELQIADLKIQQHEEKLVKEQSQMSMYAEQVSQLLATEKNLRLQLTADGEKFQQFQVTLIYSRLVYVQYTDGCFLILFTHDAYIVIDRIMVYLNKVKYL